MRKFQAREDGQCSLDIGDICKVFGICHRGSALASGGQGLPARSGEGAHPCAAREEQHIHWSSGRTMMGPAGRSQNAIWSGPLASH